MSNMITQEDTYCRVGVMPLGPWLAAGVAAGVAGVTPFPFAACWPVGVTFWLLSPLTPWDGISVVAPGKDSEPGAVNAFACAACDGCV